MDRSRETIKTNGVDNFINNESMKFLEKYLEEKERIKPLGELTTRESVEGESVGVSLVIDGYEPGIEVWWVDYATWLEEKIEKQNITL